MRTLLSTLFLLCIAASASAAVTMVVNQQSGAVLQERATQLARQLGSGLGTAISVVVLPDADQLEAWLNRYATAELALVESGYVAGKPGQFVIIGPVGRDFTLIGRQGIAGDLPQKIAPLLGEGDARPAASSPVMTTPPKPLPPQSLRSKRTDRFQGEGGLSKSVGEDRYFVSYVYRERLQRAPDAEHLEYWTQQLQSGAVTKQQLYELACDLDKKTCNFK